MIFQFIEPVVIVLSIILVLMAYGSSFKENGTRAYGWLVLSILLFLITIGIVPYYNIYSAKENIRLFKSGKVLKCTSTESQYSSQDYIVDNKSWYIKEYSFVKKNDGLMIRGDLCE
jgi:hypothetical protein